MDNNLDTLDQLEALCGQLDIPVPPPPPPEPPAPKPVALPSQPVHYQPFPDIDCWCPCDFRNLPVEPGTVDAIVTDIPWAKDWLEEAVQFSKWCARC